MVYARDAHSCAPRSGLLAQTFAGNKGTGKRQMGRLRCYSRQHTCSVGIQEALPLSRREAWIAAKRLRVVVGAWAASPRLDSQLSRMIRCYRDTCCLANVRLDVRSFAMEQRVLMRLATDMRRVLGCQIPLQKRYIRYYLALDEC